MVRVAVIGAGSCGLTASKACKEENIDFVCYEKTGRLAGLWNYHEEDIDGEACTMKNTVINSSKEITAFSDFPPPKEFPNYMHNRKMLKYFTMYAETFGLLEHIRYYHEVLKIVPTEDYEETGRWAVTTKSTETGSVQEEMFDGVMVCTGHHGYPHIPRFPGQDDFKGKICHTHSLRVPDAFKDQRVVVIGMGNSGIDAAVDISNVARQVYLSTRRGAWLMFRLGSKGLPFDTQMLTRFWDVLSKIFGSAAMNAFMENELNKNFDHATYNLKPKHRFDAQHLTVNDHLPNKILSGTVLLKGDVKMFTEKGLFFEGEGTVTRADSVVLATGYKIKYPFLSNKIVDTTNNSVELYKFMFPPHLKHPTLAIIGLIQPLGPLFPIFEAQSRWYVMLLKKKLSLPLEEDMLRDIKKTRQEMLKRYVGTQRHTVQIDYIPYMDEIYSIIGAKPNLWQIALKDPVLFYHCFFGPNVAYQYRLQGPHAWAGARKAIIETQKRIKHPLETHPKPNRNSFAQSLEFICVLYCFIFPLLVILAASLFSHVLRM